jgi:hypothetical protein
MDQGSILGIIALIFSFIGSVVTIINHKRIRSSCCGKEISTSLDIENTSPPKITIPNNIKE